MSDKDYEEIKVGDKVYRLSIKRNPKGSKLDWYWELAAPGKATPFITGNTNKKNYIKKQAQERAEAHAKES